MMPPLLPFLSATTTALLKLGGLIKLQKPLRNAVRHLQERTDLKKIGIKLAPTFLLKPIPVKSSLYSAPSQVPFLLPLYSISQTVTCKPLTVPTNFPHIYYPISPLKFPNLFEVPKKSQINEIRSAQCNLLYPAFCSPLTSLELSSAIFQLLYSTLIGLD